VEAIREVKAAAGAAGDNATEGFADDWTDQAETRVWFLSSLLG
jgi:starvation-inducible DNA-binding protein